MHIKNKTAIITGGIRGIGFVSVQHFLRRGAKFVAIFDLDEEDNHEVVTALKELEQEFGKTRFGYYCCDVVDTKRFAACFDKVSKMYESVDILVNNAGVFAEHDPDLTIAVNFTAVVHCTMYAIESMGTHKHGKGGVIVNIGSICALICLPTIPVYSATKSAVVSFVRSMKDYDKTLGVRVICLCPSMTKTKMTDTTNINPKSLLLDFVSQEIVDHHDSVPRQNPNSVASAIVEIVENGKAGDVWMQFNDQPPINCDDKKE